MSSTMTASVIDAIRKGSISVFDQPAVYVDMGLVEQIKQVHATISMVSTAIKRIEMYILRSGIDIKASGAKSFNFDMKRGPDRALFDIELYPAIKELVRHWLLYGFAVVSIAPSKVVEGAYTLVVLPLSMVEVTMKLDDAFQRTYEVGLKNTANMSTETKKVIDMAQFLCMTPPNDLGQAMSPIAMCLPELQQYKKLWDDYVLVSHRLGRPVPIFSQVSDPLGTLSAGTASRGVSQQIARGSAVAAGVGSEPTSRVFHKTEERRNEVVRDQIKEAKARLRETASSSSVDDEKRYGDPLDRLYVEPAGQRMEAGLRFDSPQDLRVMMTAIEQKFQQSLGLPNDDNVYSTAKSVDMYITLLNMNIIEFRKQASMLISHALAPIFNGRMLERVIKDVVDEDTQNTLSDDTSELDNDKLKETLNKIITDTQVTVEFSTNPVTTFELLTLYYHENVIPFEQFESLSLDLANIQKWEGKGTTFSDQQREEFEYQEQVKDKMQANQAKRQRTS